MRDVAAGDSPACRATLAALFLEGLGCAPEVLGCKGWRWGGDVGVACGTLVVFPGARAVLCGGGYDAAAGASNCPERGPC